MSHASKSEMYPLQRAGCWRTRRHPRLQPALVRTKVPWLLLLALVGQARSPLPGHSCCTAPVRLPRRHAAPIAGGRQRCSNSIRRVAAAETCKMIGLGKCCFDGDHDECDCPKRQWAKSLVHHSLVEALVRFLKDVGMVEVKSEYKYWDSARVGTDSTRRVPDVVCTHPHTHVEYVIDARIFWNSMSAGSMGYLSYSTRSACQPDRC